MDPNRIPVYTFFELFKNIIPTELSRIIHKYYYIVRICEKCSRIFDKKSGENHRESIELCWESIYNNDNNSYILNLIISKIKKINRFSFINNMFLYYFQKVG